MYLTKKIIVYTSVKHTFFTSTYNFFLLFFTSWWYVTVVIGDDVYMTSQQIVYIVNCLQISTECLCTIRYNR